MNRKLIDSHTDTDQQKNGEYAVRRSRRSNVIAAAVCLLLALVVWTVIMSTGDTDYVAVRVMNPQDEFEYTLSVDLLEVGGSVGALRRADRIGVILPENAVSGVYHLTVDDLALPEGVYLLAEPDIVLTVRAK